MSTHIGRPTHRSSPNPDQAHFRTTWDVGIELQSLNPAGHALYFPLISHTVVVWYVLAFPSVLELTALSG